MKVREGQWIRTKHNTIEQVGDLYQWFGVKAIDREKDDSYNDTDGYIINISSDPRLLLVSGDLVEWGGYIVEVFVDEKTKDLYTAAGSEPMLRNNIAAIWTLNDYGNHMLQWEEKE